MEAMKTKWKLVKLAGSTHRKCKAAAALEGKELQAWIAETLEARLNKIEGKRELACVRK